MSANEIRQPTSLLQLSGFPQVCALDPAPTAEQVFGKLSHLPHCLFLDSSLPHDSLARYSFIAADPFEEFVVPVGTPGALDELRSRMSRFRCDPRRDLPPFQGGVAGLFAYELAQSIEPGPQAEFAELSTPAISLGFFDVVAAFDHLTEQAWLISHGWPETEPARRRARAHQRLTLFHDLVQKKRQRPPTTKSPLAPIEIASPHFPVQRHAGLFSNFTSSQYQEVVGKTIETIRRGDIFQANISQRLLMQATAPSREVYLRLRAQTPATFAAYYDGGAFQIMSASPERFLKIADRQVEARPIKGTRPITNLPEVDQARAADLKQSEKDRAENVMIVDLLRNDLSRACHPDSIEVSQLCGLEAYGYVQHLVSVVRAELAEDKHAIDVIAAAFPGGSITGAPKRRAMEVITDLERVTRGAYCGSLGYIGWDGSLDLNILIRTITASHGWWQLPVGGGITAGSDPEDELNETWDKAAGILRAL